MEKEIAKNSNTNFIEEGVGYIYNNPVYCISVGLVSYGVFSVVGTLLSSYFYAQQLNKQIFFKTKGFGDYSYSNTLGNIKLYKAFDLIFLYKDTSVVQIDYMPTGDYESFSDYITLGESPEFSTLGLASLLLGFLGVTYTSLLGDDDSLKSQEGAGEF